MAVDHELPGLRTPGADCGPLRRRTSEGLAGKLHVLIRAVLDRGTGTPYGRTTGADSLIETPAPEG